MAIEKIVLSVEGMSCNHCVNSIHKGVGALKGIQLVAADLTSKTVTVEFEGEKVTIDQIKEVIEDEGYEVL